MIDDELRRLALAARAEPWVPGYPDSGTRAFERAVSPDVVLGLLDRLAEAEAVVKVADAAYENGLLNGEGECRDRLAEERAARERVEAAAWAAAETIELDANWLHDNVPNRSPDGVATLKDITREIAKAAVRLRAALATPGGTHE